MSDKNIERIRLWTLILCPVFLFTTCLFGYLWITKPCPPCYESGKTVVEVIPVKDSSLKQIVVKVPEAFKIEPNHVYRKSGNLSASNQHAQNLSISPDTVHITSCDTTIIFEPSPCSDIAYYSDTITGDSCRAVINDTVSDNRITGRSVWMVNLKPDTKITVVKREKWKFYLGGSFTINQNNTQRWGVGPSALLTIPKVGGISYYFDAKNFAHTGTFFALIRFHK